MWSGTTLCLRSLGRWKISRWSEEELFYKPERVERLSLIGPDHHCLRQVWKVGLVSCSIYVLPQTPPHPLTICNSQRRNEWKWTNDIAWGACLGESVNFHISNLSFSVTPTFFPTYMHTHILVMSLHIYILQERKDRWPNVPQHNC